jgi:peroxiredoxin
MRSVRKPSHPARPGRLPFLLASALLALSGGWAPAEQPAPGAPDAGRGTLRARYPEFSLLVTDAGAGSKSSAGVERVQGRDGAAQVGAGSYYVLDWRVNTRDAAGRKWEAAGNAWPNPIVVPAGGSVAIPVATPVRACLQGMENNGQYHFHLEYTGPFGERCRGITVDGGPPPPPTIRILDTSGRVVGRAQFGTKCGGTCHAAWPIPAGLTGHFRAVPEPKLGPIPVDVGAGLSFELRGSRVVNRPPSVGQPAPEFTLVTHSGQSIQLGFLRRRPVILNFFCNCGLCRAFATELGRATDLREKAEILVVTADAGVAEDDAFRTETGLPATYIHDSPPVIAPRYASEACPRCWLIDTNGIIRYVNPDRLMPAKKLVTDLRAALASPKAASVKQNGGPHRPLR